jgi:hypothetical protein
MNTEKQEEQALQIRAVALYCFLAIMAGVTGVIVAGCIWFIETIVSNLP